MKFSMTIDPLRGASGLLASAALAMMLSTAFPAAALATEPARLPGLPGTPPRIQALPASMGKLPTRKNQRLLNDRKGVVPVQARGLPEPGAKPTTTGAKGPVVHGQPARLPPPPSTKTDDKSGKGESGAKEESTHKKIEDVITFKSNYEKDVRCRKLPLDQKISIDFEDAPLEDVVKFIGCITEQNFIVDTKKVRGKTITIMSPKPVTVYEAYKAFLSTLEMNALTVVPLGKFLKITTAKTAATDHGPILMKRGKLSKEDRIVSYLHTLEHVQATEILDVIAKFKTANGDLYVYEPSNTLIITDTAWNVRRLLRLITELDIPTGKERIFIRPVLYAEANEFVDKINQLFGVQGAGSQKKKKKPAGRKKKGAAPTVGTSGNAPGVVSKVLADDRTNQLIIVATRTGYLLVDRFLRKMDVPIPGEGELHIYRLQNADAKEVAETLQSLTQKKSSSNKRKRGKSSKKKKGSSSRSGAALFEGEVNVTAHEQTNSLLIEASLSDFVAMKSVIEQLDVRRKQVYVEALIMEITTSKNRKFGISGSGGSTVDVDGEVVPLLFGLGGLGVSNFDMNQLNKGGLAVGMQGPLVDLSTGTAGPSGLAGTMSIPSFGFMLQAIASNSDVNIISTPHILTMENEEAEIQVGKRIPYQSTSFGGGLGALSALGGLSSQMGGMNRQMGGLGGLSALGGLGGMGGMGTVQFIEADLTLKIKPQVNESNFVRLEIDQSIEDVESIDRTLGPTTSKRKVTNVVVVRDEQPVVIGGLIRASESEGLDKVPFLGDIPVFGILFRKTTVLKEKKNLLMIIVPHIIRDPSDLERIHAKRLEEIREFNDYMDQKKAALASGIDYRKKHGALEEMRRTLDTQLERQRLIDVLEARESEDLLGTPESHALDFEAPEEEMSEDSAPQTPVDAVQPETEEIDLEAAPEPEAQPPGELP